MKRILILDDNLTICLMLKSWLVKKDYDAVISTSVDEAKQLIKDQPFDLILSDIRMPETDGFSFLSWVKKYDSGIMVIMMTSFSDVETAVESMKMGAVDYIAKPIEPDLFFRKIEDAFKLQENMIENSFFHKKIVKPPFEKYRLLFEMLDTVAAQTNPLLIVGGRGTGKVSAARYIYDKGYGVSKPFVQLDEYYPEKFHLLNNEKDVHRFFEDKFIKAAGGILYIREVEILSKAAQNELLCFLQTQKEDDSFVRIIFSSAKKEREIKDKITPDLLQLVDKKIITLPSLKGQKQDILFFSDHFLAFANSEFGKKIKKISPAFVKKMLEYPWPGNIRELKNIIIKAALLTDETEIKAAIIPRLFGTEEKIPQINVPGIRMEELKKENYERAKITEALELAKGNKTLAASILNIDRKTLYNKIKNYGVDLPI